MRERILAIYMRTSLEDHEKALRLTDRSFSIENQRRLIEDFAAKDESLRSLRPVEYIDDGFTGTNMTRPGFQGMIDDVKTGKIACIIVKDLSRFGRSYLEVGDYLERVLPANGVRLISVNDHYDSESLTGTTGGLDIAFRNFIYDSYSRDLSVKIRTAMYTRMEKGKFVNHPPYGYAKDPSDRHRMIPDPETAPIVREIFRKIIAGTGTSETAKQLNMRGVPTPLQYKRHKLRPDCRDRKLLWSHATIINIVYNYKYTGAMVNHTRENRCLRDTSQRRIPPSEWIITEGTHEALVTRSEFELANKKLRRPEKAQPRAGHLRDNVFYCAYCGRKLQKTFGHDTYFSCRTRKYVEGAPCAELRWSRSELEDVLICVYRLQLSLIGETLAKYRRRVRSADTAASSGHAERIEQELARCDRQKMQLFESYHDAVIDLDAFMEKKAEIIKRQARLREELAGIRKSSGEEGADSAKKPEEVKRLSGFLRGDSLPREQMITHMYEDLDRVAVGVNKEIEIHWKFDSFLQAAMEAV